MKRKHHLAESSTGRYHHSQVQGGFWVMPGGLSCRCFPSLLVQSRMLTFGSTTIDFARAVGRQYRWCVASRAGDPPEDLAAISESRRANASLDVAAKLVFETSGMSLIKNKSASQAEERQTESVSVAPTFDSMGEPGTLSCRCFAAKKMFRLEGGLAPRYLCLQSVSIAPALLFSLCFIT